MLLPINRAGKSGYLDLDGNVVVQPKYQFAGDFHEGLGYLITNKNEIAIVNESGSEVGRIEEADAISWFSYGLLAFGRGGVSGFSDEHGNEVISPRFKFARNFHDGCAAVSFGKKWGVIDTSGDLIIKAEFDWIERFSNGAKAIACATQTGNDRAFSLIGMDGVMKTKRSYPFLGVPTDNIVPAANDGTNLFGWIDFNEDWIVEPRFASLDAYEFSEGTIGARTPESLLWGIAGIDGDWIVPPTYNAARHFVEGLAAVYVGGKIDQDDCTVGGKWGFIDRSGRVVIPPTLDETTNFRNGVASICQYNEGSGDEVNGYIDKTGRFIWRSM